MNTPDRTRRKDEELLDEIIQFINKQKMNFSLAKLSKELEINSETAKKWTAIIEKAQSEYNTIKRKKVDDFMFWDVDYMSPVAEADSLRDKMMGRL